jgi:predicted nucleic-acid-binding protein
MTGLDTNILVRHYTQDDPVQSPLATQFLAARCTEAEPGWISVPVQCELAWVRRNAYK